LRTLQHRTESEAIMNLSTTAALTALALSCSAPVSAWDGWSGEPALRLPGEQTQNTSPSLKLRTWANDLSDRLAVIARPQLPELQWRGEGVSAPAVRPPAGHPWLVERTRTALTAHWRPWTVGHWKLGAAMGLHRVLPSTSSGARTPGFAAMPMASYEQTHYRVNLGLVPPSGDRASALVLGLTVPLH
jgi:hypothetical protein